MISDHTILYYYKQVVYARDNKLCQYCLAPATTLDHIVPLRQGGPWTESNLVAACRPCNQIKGSRSFFEFIQERSPQLYAKGQPLSDIVERILSICETPLMELPKELRVLIRDRQQCQLCQRIATTAVRITKSSTEWIAVCAGCKKKKGKMSVSFFLGRASSYLLRYISVLDLQLLRDRFQVKKETIAASA